MLETDHKDLVHADVEGMRGDEYLDTDDEDDDDDEELDEDAGSSFAEAGTVSTFTYTERTSTWCASHSRMIGTMYTPEECQQKCTDNIDPADGGSLTCDRGVVMTDC